MAGTNDDSFWNPAAYALSERLRVRLHAFRAEASRLASSTPIAESEWPPRDELAFLLDKAFADLIGVARTRAGAMTEDRRRACERWLNESPFGGRRGFAAWLRGDGNAEQLALFIEQADYLRLMMLHSLTAAEPAAGGRRSA